MESFRSHLEVVIGSSSMRKPCRAFAEPLLHEAVPRTRKFQWTVVALTLLPLVVDRSIVNEYVQYQPSPRQGVLPPLSPGPPGWADGTRKKYMEVQRPAITMQTQMTMGHFGTDAQYGAPGATGGQIETPTHWYPSPRCDPNSIHGQPIFKPDPNDFQGLRPQRKQIMKLVKEVVEDLEKSGRPLKEATREYDKRMNLEVCGINFNSTKGRMMKYYPRLYDWAKLWGKQQPMPATNMHPRHLEGGSRFLHYEVLRFILGLRPHIGYNDYHGHRKYCRAMCDWLLFKPQHEFNGIPIAFLSENMIGYTGECNGQGVDRQNLYIMGTVYFCHFIVFRPCPGHVLVGTVIRVGTEYIQAMVFGKFHALIDYQRTVKGPKRYRRLDPPDMHFPNFVPEDWDQGKVIIRQDIIPGNPSCPIVRNLRSGSRVQFVVRRVFSQVQEPKHFTIFGVLVESSDGQPSPVQYEEYDAEMTHQTALNVHQ